MKKNKQPEQPEPKIKVVTDLSELETLCAAPLQCEVVIRGQAYAFEGRRLNPAECHEVRQLMEQALPQVIVKEGQQPEYDLDNPEYRKQREICRRDARALALWTAFPVFKALAAKVSATPKNTPEIRQFIESRQLEDDLLQALFEALTLRMVEAKAYVGFSSGSSSQNG